MPKKSKKRAKNGQKNHDPDPNSKFKNSNGARWGLDGAQLLFSRLQNLKKYRAKKRAKNGQKNRDPDPNSKFKNSNGASPHSAPLVWQSTCVNIAPWEAY